VLRLSEPEGNELLSAIDYDYQAIVDCIIIDGQTLSIDRHRLDRGSRVLDDEVIVPETFKMRIRIELNKNPSHITELANEHESSMAVSDHEEQTNRQ
jgi:hypothetical protein